jgi:hypothetical protein
MLLAHYQSAVSLEVDMEGMIKTLPSCKAKGSVQHLEVILVFSDIDVYRKMLRR